MSRTPRSSERFHLPPSRVHPVRCDTGTRRQPRHPDAPKDLVQTAGARNNHGYVIPSLDLVFVRVGDGQKFAKGFEQDLVKKVLASVK